ncbi:MAG: hypothetical protein U0K86_06965 [Agathobacter sp.]|nr:hypothetical protein [Agathobacter sp.]
MLTRRVSAPFCGVKPRFLYLTVNSFRNEIINDEENHDIPDFWGECHDKNLLELIRNLRPEGKRDLFGLCSPTKEEENTFDYGIGVIIDEETLNFDVDEIYFEKGRDGLFCELWIPVRIKK